MTNLVDYIPALYLSVAYRLITTLIIGAALKKQLAAHPSQAVDLGHSELGEYQYHHGAKKQPPI